MTDDEKKPDERRKLLGMLQSLYEISEHATLTGAFKKGAEDGAAHYNRIVARLAALGEIDESLFPPLDEATTTFHQVGVSAKLLRGWLQGADDESCKAFGLRVDLDGLSQLGELGRKIRDEWKVEKTVRVSVDNDEAGP